MTRNDVEKTFDSGFEGLCLALVSKLTSVVLSVLVSDFRTLVPFDIQCKKSDIAICWYDYAFYSVY